MGKVGEYRIDCKYRLENRFSPHDGYPVICRHGRGAALALSRKTRVSVIHLGPKTGPRELLKLCQLVYARLCTEGDLLKMFDTGGKMGNRFHEVGSYCSFIAREDLSERIQ